MREPLSLLGKKKINSFSRVVSVQRNTEALNPRKGLDEERKFKQEFAPSLVERSTIGLVN